MKYKVGDRVKIKSLDWYNENKNEMNPTIACYCDQETVIEDIITITIKDKGQRYVVKLGNHGKMYITDEMIEGLAEEEDKPKYEDEVNGEYYSTPKYLVRPNGYQFKDENGNVINAMKIVLEKKKKEYPKTYEECREILKEQADVTYGYKKVVLHLFQKLIVCRDAYWKIAGEEMGLGKPWEPSDSDYITGRYCIFVHRGNIICDTPAQDCILTFPTEEMRDAFKKNFEPDIEICKELL